MNIEKYCIQLTGIQDGLAARKVTLLIFTAMLFSLGCAYYSVTYVDAGMEEVVRVMNQDAQRMPVPTTFQ